MPAAAAAATFALLAWPAEAGPEVGRRYRDLIDGGAPVELGGALAYITGPPEEFVPEPLRGGLIAGVIVVYAGGEAEAREAIAPLLELEPAGLPPTEMPSAEIQCAIDDPPGFRNYWSVEHLSGFPDEAAATCLSGLADGRRPAAGRRRRPWLPDTLPALDSANRRI